MTTPAATSIVYPETDGMPLPDGASAAVSQSRWSLEVHFREFQARE